MKKSTFLTKVVTGILIFLFLFTVAILFLFYKTGGMEPSVLVGAVFVGTLGELGICGWIQHGKMKTEQHEEDDFDDEY